MDLQQSLHLPDSFRSPAHFGLLGFQGPESGRAEYVFPEITFAVPGHSTRIGCLGLRRWGAADIPGSTFSEGDGRTGLPFGRAVVQELSREHVAALLRRLGKPLSEDDVRDLLAPMLAKAFRGLLVIAGVRAPPEPNGCYVPFRAEMLSYWRFIPGEDCAYAKVAGAADFMAVRVFTPREWDRVESNGGVLLQVDGASCSTAEPKKARPLQQDVNDWMLRYAQAALPRTPKLPDARADCMKAIGASWDQATEAHQQLPDSLRNSQGRPKKASAKSER
jgi:hypothetical protein